VEIQNLVPTTGDDAGHDPQQDQHRRLQGRLQRRPKSSVALALHERLDFAENGRS